jgi:Mrp family chromosome partitioning ATPase
MPPLLAADDMLSFERCTDAVLFVISERKTKRTDAIKARELMSELNVIGTVLNQSDERTATYY